VLSVRGARRRRADVSPALGPTCHVGREDQDGGGTPAPRGGGRRCGAAGAPRGGRWRRLLVAHGAGVPLPHLQLGHGHLSLQRGRRGGRLRGLLLRRPGAAILLPPLVRERRAGLAREGAPQGGRVGRGGYRRGARGLKPPLSSPNYT